MTTKNIPIDKISLEGCQSRAGTCDATVEEYAELWKAGAEFPPVILFSDGAHYHCGDGHHRILGAQRADIETILAQVVKGGVSDALWYSAGANSAHGKRRTNADKRKAVKIALELKSEMSDRAIAEHCGVGTDLVSSVRGQLSENDSSKSPAKRVGKDGKARSLPKPAAKKSESTRTDGKISGGNTFDVAEIEAASKPKPPKNGRPILPTKRRKELGEAIRILIRFSDDFGLDNRFITCLRDLHDEVSRA